MFINGLIYPPLFNLFNGENSDIEECIQWADEKYDSVCKSSDSAVAILYLREQSVYRSLIVYNNGAPKRYDDCSQHVLDHKRSTVLQYKNQIIPYHLYFLIII